MAQSGLVRLLVGPVCFIVGALCYHVFFGPGTAKIDPILPVMQRSMISSEVTNAFSPSATRVVQGKDDLFDKVKVLCWILTYPSNHATKAKAVKETWASRCNKAVFMSSEVDASIPTIDLKMSGEGRDKLWEKSRKAWYYLYQHFIDDYDWFMKADDDSFLIVENLRYFCSLHDANGDFYFGRVFKPFGNYQSGGAGYVVSRGALKKVGPLLAEDEKCAHNIPQVEDAKFGACLKEVGVKTGDSQDHGKDRFHPFVPEQHLIPGIIPTKFWYRDYVMYPTKEGPECCSDLSISFHYITPNLMHELYFYVYNLHPYGLAKDDDNLPLPLYKRRPGQQGAAGDVKYVASAKKQGKADAVSMDAKPKNAASVSYSAVPVKAAGNVAVGNS